MIALVRVHYRKLNVEQLSDRKLIKLFAELQYVKTAEREEQIKMMTQNS